MESIKNKIIFITGASSGFGKACAEIFAKEGAKLILCARRLKQLEDLQKELIEKYNSKIYCFKIDIRNQKDVLQAIENLPNEFSDIDILINNAGLSRGLNKIQDGKIEDWEEMIDTNVKGLLYVTKAVIPIMLKKKSGHIVNIGSVAGHEVYPNGNVYCATKHAVNAISKGLKMDLLGTNIRVSSIDPGLAETEFSLVRFHGDEEKAKKVYQGFEPLQAKDIAETVLFCITRPAHVNINEIILMPTAQSSSTLVHRS